VKIERDLHAIVPAEEWGALSLRLIEHGRRVCDARRPRCDACTLAPLCPSAGRVTPPRRAPAARQSDAPPRSRVTRSKDRRAATSARSAE
jgi:endonuclease-3